jgi:PPIC-type PPIASE domain
MKLLITRTLREPLLHFVLAGVLLFAGYHLLAREPRAADVSSVKNPVVIDEGAIAWLKQTFSQQQRRPPTQDELKEMLANLIEEQLLSREAKEMGLDKDDTVIRRRLAQKLSFLIGGTSEGAEPTEGELHSYYEEHSEMFSAVGQVSFEQIYFSSEGRKNPEEDARAALAALGGPDAPSPDTLGDPLLIGAKFDSIAQPQISNAFGEAFAKAVFQIDVNRWSEPIKSAYGFHLVRPRMVTPGRRLSFEEARNQVLREYRQQREREFKDDYLRKLRAKYGVEYVGSAGALQRLVENRAASE